MIKAARKFVARAFSFTCPPLLPLTNDERKVVIKDIVPFLLCRLCALQSQVLTLLLKRWEEKELHIAHALYLGKSWLEEEEKEERVGEGRSLAKMEEG